MPPTKQRPPASSNVAKNAIEQASLSLAGLPERPREAWSLREAIAMLLPPITTALERGYSYEEISSILSSSGVSITASSLKRYLATARRQQDDSTPRTTTRGKTGRTRKPRTPKVEAPAEEPAPAAAPVADPMANSPVSPPKRRPRSATRTKSATKPASKTAAKTKSPRATSTAKTTTRSTRSRKKADG